LWVGGWVVDGGWRVECRGWRVVDGGWRVEQACALATPRVRARSRAIQRARQKAPGAAGALPCVPPVQSFEGTYTLTLARANDSRARVTERLPKRSASLRSACCAPVK